MPPFFGIDLRVVNSSRSYIFIVFHQPKAGRSPSGVYGRNIGQTKARRCSTEPSVGVDAPSPPLYPATCSNLDEEILALSEIQAPTEGRSARGVLSRVVVFIR
ncbi:hypothetical protein DY000_02052975 [Brassica cretica]|uniref:Uncharacterized protein n=1 Tax=Brassica cretica TaxID=69181 RepID=A0ABQ7ADC7_BRACR|nr:hypothetical protein DY000_02052975 [Brassica cretica]